MWFAKGVRLLVLLVASLCCIVRGQDTAAKSSYTAQREQLLAPGLQAMQIRDYATALSEFRAVLMKYPNDARVLMLAGNAARLTKNFDEAIRNYLAALHQPSSNLWPIHFALVEAYAGIERWDDFNRERQLVRTAKQNGDPQLARVSGYQIDHFEVGDRMVVAMEFPVLAGRYHTRYRFSVSPKNPSAEHSAGSWAPYIDLESDDIDQQEFAKEHLDKAAAGERSFSLDGYLAPRTHSSIKFYWDGEPDYPAVRSDVIAVLSKTLKPMSTSTHSQ